MNYGDLLFPVVVEELYREILGSETVVTWAAPSSADTAAWGLEGTVLGIEDAVRRCPPESQLVIVVAGGEVLAVDWEDAVLCLKERLDLPARLVRKISGKRAVNTLIGSRYAPSLKLPYLICGSSVGREVKVVYHASGGTGLERKPDWFRKVAEDSLRSAACVTVRDHDTASQVGLLTEGDVEVAVVPDSVVELSRLFPVERLAERATPAVRDLVASFGEKGYACFQCSAPFSHGREAEIAAAVTGAGIRSGLPVVLLSIGRAWKHLDHLALREINGHMDEPLPMPEDTTIFDIAYLIASAKAFMGTSLHGAITSLSYAVPHVAVNPGSRKLSQFLGAWDIEAQRDCVDIPEIPEKLQQVLEVPARERDALRDRLIEVSQQNLQKIVRPILTGATGAVAALPV